MAQPVTPVADSRYKWIALSNITLGTLMVFINQSIVLIALPAIFRGISLNPLTPANTGYGVLYGSLSDCVESAVTGRLTRDEALWR